MQLCARVELGSKRCHKPRLAPPQAMQARANTPPPPPPPARLPRHFTRAKYASSVKLAPDCWGPTSNKRIHHSR